MKLIAMTAALLCSTAAFAQTNPGTNTPPSGTTAPTTQGGAMTPADPAAPATEAPMQDSMTPAPAPDSTMTPAPAPMQDGMTPPPPADAPMQQPMQQPMAATGEDPKGGYMPAQPPISGTRTPGAQVQFVAAPPPSQAYPAPAPLAEYPVCKRGQTDGCRNRGE